MTTATHRYSTPAMALHWLLALMIAIAFSVGLYMHVCLCRRRD